MLASIPALFAFLTLVLTSAVPVVNNQVVSTEVPTLPEGFFTGENNADGTTTVHFPGSNKTVTYEGKSPPRPLEGRSAGLMKRMGSECWHWQGELNHLGVDKGIEAFRAIFRRFPKDKGYLGYRYGRQYFGFNFEGVYVYFCLNTKERQHWDSFDMVDLNWGSFWMDQDCGGYKAGYYHWDSPSLFGKTRSGTAVCLA